MPNNVPLRDLLQSLESMEKSVQEANQQIEIERSKANFFMRTVLIMLACLALVNIYYVHVLFQEFRVMVTNMVEMYEHFGRVSDRMDSMTIAVTDMEQNIKMMPVIHLQMQAMNHNISSMTGNMNHMVGDMSGMDNRISIINYDVNTMTGRFRSVDNNVGNIQNNVGEMSNILP